MKRFFLYALLPLTLAACSQSPQRENAAPAVTVNTAALSAYHWRLSDARDAQGQRIEALFVRDDRPVQLDFGDNRFSVSNTCNQMGGGYSIQGDKIIFGRMASTLMMCADNRLARLDREIGERLAGAASLALTSDAQPQLTLSTTAGDVLVFDGEPTAETRYGGKGEIMFLEIGPQMRPCSHPLIPNMQCMQVRRVYFDEKGLKSTPSPQWENFYQSIDGYAHENGIRNVVRVKRFKIANPPADAPDTAYVLDMVVESEIVKP